MKHLVLLFPPVVLAGAVGALLAEAYGLWAIPLALPTGFFLGFSGRGIMAFVEDRRYLKRMRGYDAAHRSARHL